MNTPGDHQQYVINTRRARSRRRTAPRVQGMTRAEYIDCHINRFLDHCADRRTGATHAPNHPITQSTKHPLPRLPQAFPPGR